MKALLSLLMPENLRNKAVFAEENTRRGSKTGNPRFFIFLCLRNSVIIQTNGRNGKQTVSARA